MVKHIFRETIECANKLTNFNLKADFNIVDLSISLLSLLLLNDDCRVMMSFCHFVSSFSIYKKKRNRILFLGKLIDLK